MTATFFEGLGARGHEDAWADVSGTVGIDLVDGDTTERWFIKIDKGDIAVSHDEREADCNLRVDRAVFEQLIQGQANGMAAALRGAAIPSGNLDLLLALQRAFPGPRDQQRPAPIGRSDRWNP